MLPEGTDVQRDEESKEKQAEEGLDKENKERGDKEGKEGEEGEEGEKEEGTAADAAELARILVMSGVSQAALTELKQSQAFNKYSIFTPPFGHTGRNFTVSLKEDSTTAVLDITDDNSFHFSRSENWERMLVDAAAGKRFANSLCPFAVVSPSVFETKKQANRVSGADFMVRRVEEFFDLANFFAEKTGHSILSLIPECCYYDTSCVVYLISTMSDQKDVDSASRGFYDSMGGKAAVALVAPSHKKKHPDTLGPLKAARSQATPSLSRASCDSCFKLLKSSARVPGCAEDTELCPM